MDISFFELFLLWTFILNNYNKTNLLKNYVKYYYFQNVFIL